jgi:hypothetical protein
MSDFFIHGRIRIHFLMKWDVNGFHRRGPFSKGEFQRIPAHPCGLIRQKSHQRNQKHGNGKHPFENPKPGAKGPIYPSWASEVKQVNGNDTGYGRQQVDTAEKGEKTDQTAHGFGIHPPGQHIGKKQDKKRQAQTGQSGRLQSQKVR